jgi:hypothetical protein
VEGFGNPVRARRPGTRVGCILVAAMQRKPIGCRLICEKQELARSDPRAKRDICLHSCFSGALSHLVRARGAIHLCVDGTYNVPGPERRRSWLIQQSSSRVSQRSEGWHGSCQAASPQLILPLLLPGPGVTREWCCCVARSRCADVFLLRFNVVSKQLFNPDYALFSPLPSNKGALHPRLSCC